MKTNRFIQICTVASSFALAAVVFASVAPAPAPEKETAAQKKARIERETLEKYDMNLNGKMDPDEIAIQKADATKAAAEKRKATLAKKKADAETAKTSKATKAPAVVTTPAKTAPPKKP